MNWKYYYWRFREEFLGGYERVKELASQINIIEDIKSTYKRLKEDDEYEAIQKRYAKKEVLHEGDILVFHDPQCYGNEIEAQVLANHFDIWSNYRMVYLKVINSGLHEKGSLLDFYQSDIMQNIIQYRGDCND